MGIRVMPVAWIPRNIQVTKMQRCLLLWVMGLAFSILSRGCGGGGGSSSGGTVPPSPAAELRGFDADKSLDLLKAQVAFGPRVPGTQAHTDALNYIFDQLKEVTDSQEKQSFAATIGGKKVTLTNIIGVIKPSAKRKRQAASRILLGAHWDCRPIADRDPDPANRDKPIDGANDGASGVAMLLEAARILKSDPPNVEVVIVFFDAEDSALYDEMFTGSEYFAANMGAYRPNQAIVVDMIGDANLNVNREQNSLNSDAALYNSILSSAKDIGFSSHFTGGQMYVTDDHISLINAGVPSIDLIDFEYPDSSNRYWHTLADTVDKCSGDSLMIVGETVLRTVYGLQG